MSLTYLGGYNNDNMYLFTLCRMSSSLMMIVQGKLEVSFLFLHIFRRGICGETGAAEAGGPRNSGKSYLTHVDKSHNDNVPPIPPSLCREYEAYCDAT